MFQNNLTKNVTSDILKIIAYKMLTHLHLKKNVKLLTLCNFMLYYLITDNVYRHRK